MKIAARAAAVTAALVLAMTAAHPQPAGAAPDANPSASPSAPSPTSPPSTVPSPAPASPAPASPPAGSPSASPSGTTEHTIAMGDWNRPYLLHVPPDRADGEPLPLIVALHGGLNDPQYVREQSGLDAVADAQGYAVAYPKGLLGTWNAGACCWFARWAGVDDVAFLDELIGTLVEQGVADRRRIFLTGFSNGGGMAYRYACERAGRVAGVAVVSGALAIGCTPDRPISVLAFHGTWDPSVPYFGGGNLDADVKFPFLPVRLLMEFWRWIGGLSAMSWPLRDAPDGCVGTAPGPVRVALCTIQRGGHEWPSFASGLIASFFDSRPSLPAS
ncbi:alpha/beta hydrolase family esterase [Actinomadura algeriensis]|uniref:Polyhydroxybutyrate depolymerase n=1 Tax=Actinomadura algeriensis TaxID=1679523 RepID=A0ABR9JZC9_9ACTN|nr:PHB depolymerase family esterase [Actinomadura algeriensis]MBE1535926.1 polyhydroxybutyrate depolymerase [Actinomadura algeriensis]